MGHVFITKQRSFQNLSKYLTCLGYIQEFNLSVCTLCPCLTSFPWWNWDMHANNNEIPARSTCHVSRERAVLGLIALRKHDTQHFFLICVKKFHLKPTCYRYAIEWAENLNLSFFLTIQFYRSRACDPRACLTAMQQYVHFLYVVCLFCFVLSFVFPPSC